MFHSSQEAETAFYAAFESADLEAMMKVWAEEPTIVCIHPMSARIEGWAAVRESWAQILSGSGDELQFKITNSIISESDGLATHLVYENITFGPGMTERSIVLATNVYRNTDSGWRMICHHGSPGRVGAVQIMEPTGPMH